MNSRFRSAVHRQTNSMIAFDSDPAAATILSPYRTHVPIIEPIWIPLMLMEILTYDSNSALSKAENFSRDKALPFSRSMA